VPFTKHWNSGIFFQKFPLLQSLTWQFSLVLRSLIRSFKSSCVMRWNSLSWRPAMKSASLAVEDWVVFFWFSVGLSSESKMNCCGGIGSGRSAVWWAVRSEDVSRLVPRPPGYRFFFVGGGGVLLPCTRLFPYLFMFAETVKVWRWHWTFLGLYARRPLTLPCFLFLAVLLKTHRRSGRDGVECYWTPS